MTGRKCSIGGQALLDLYEQVCRKVKEASKFTDWAKDEIDQAMKRHPEQADRIFHAFGLLVPTVSSRG